MGIFCFGLVTKKCMELMLVMDDLFFVDSSIM